MVLISPVIDTTLATAPLFPLARSITVPFKVTVDPDQAITFARVFARIDIIDTAFTSRQAQIFFNDRLIGEFFWSQFDDEPFIIDRVLNLQGVKPNQNNEITIIVEQGISPVFAGAVFKVFADFFYVVRNIDTGVEEDPTEPPTLEEPVMVEGDSGFDILDFLFGDLEKTTRTVVAIVAVIAAIVVIPPVVRLVRG